MTSAVALLESLNEAEIARRLDQLDREARALRVLLRASRARGRPAPRAGEATADREASTQQRKG
jgi:hypothetical protein